MRLGLGMLDLRPEKTEGDPKSLALLPLLVWSPPYYIKLNTTKKGPLGIKGLLRSVYKLKS